MFDNKDKSFIKTGKRVKVWETFTKSWRTGEVISVDGYSYKAKIRYDVEYPWMTAIESWESFSDIENVEDIINFDIEPPPFPCSHKNHKKIPFLFCTIVECTDCGKYMGKIQNGKFIQGEEDD